MKCGEMVRVRGKRVWGGSDLCGKGWGSFPGVYGYHQLSWVVDGTMGVVLEERENMWCVLIGGVKLWMDEGELEGV